MFGGRFHFRFRVLAVALVALGLAWCAVRAPADAPRRYALLVGCTKYDNNKSFRLVGPGNDVELLKTVLADKLAFPPENIVTLSEKAGGQFRPTYANIAREFAALAGKAKPGDQVVILLGGHGSQQPERDPPDRHYPKPNGRDQIFLPADIGVWDGGKQNKVVNSIADYELREWTKAITKTGASLWLIVDACCSGSMNRGQEVPRRIEPADLGIPATALAAAEHRARERGGPRGDKQHELLFEIDDQSPNFVALYAARPDEPTVERPMPMDDDDSAPNESNAKTHGILSYTLCEILQRSGGNLSYLDLHELICNCYTQMGRTAGPKPIIEGLARERKIFAPMIESAPARGGNKRQLRIRLQTTPTGDWKINAGRLQGVTAGSVLAVLSPKDHQAAKKPLGHVRVKEARTLDSLIEPCEYAGQPPPGDDQLTPDAPCELVYRDYGSWRLKLAIDRGAREVKPASNANRPSSLDDLERELRKLGDQRGALFSVVERSARPDWVVQARDNELVFLGADAAAIDGKLPDGVPRFVLSSHSPVKSLVDAIGHVFRARNLLALTAPSMDITHPDRDEQGLANDNAAVDVEIEMRRLRDENDTKGTIIKPDGRELVIPAGQWVGWQVTNHSRFKVDVTLLFIDSELNIVSAFPRAGSGIDNTITPGGRILAGPARTTKTTFDLDRVVAIAVKSEGQPIDFSVLEQQSLTAGHGALRGPGDPTLDSPLGRLMQTALYGAGGTRGGMDLTGSPHTLSLISWRVK